MMNTNESQMDVVELVDQYEDLLDPLTGKVIKSGFGSGFFRDRFDGKRKPRPNAINLTIIGSDKYGEERSHVHTYLRKVGIDPGPEKVLAIDKIGQKTYIVEFVSIAWRRYAISRTLKEFSHQYKVFPLVPDTIKVHVGSVPPYMSDETVLRYLRCFGTFPHEDQEVIREHDDLHIHSSTRIYSATDLEVHMPSYTWINGEQLTIYYRNQPFTCRLCDRRGHKAYNCQYAEVDRYGRKKRVNFAGAGRSNSAWYSGRRTWSNSNVNSVSTTNAFSGSVSSAASIATSLTTSSANSSSIDNMNNTVMSTNSATTTTMVSENSVSSTLSNIVPRSSVNTENSQSGSVSVSTDSGVITVTACSTRSSSQLATTSGSGDLLKKGAGEKTNDRAGQHYAKIIKSALPKGPPDLSFDVDPQIYDHFNEEYPHVNNALNQNPQSKRESLVLKVPKALARRSQIIRKNRANLGEEASSAVDNNLGPVDTKKHENKLNAKWNEVQVLLQEDGSGGSDPQKVEAALLELKDLLPSDDENVSEEEDADKVAEVVVPNTQSPASAFKQVLEHDLKMLSNCHKRAEGIVVNSRLDNPIFQSLLYQHLKALNDREKVDESDRTLKRSASASRTQSDEEPEKHIKHGEVGEGLTVYDDRKREVHEVLKPPTS